MTGLCHQVWPGLLSCLWSSLTWPDPSCERISHQSLGYGIPDLNSYPIPQAMEALWWPCPRSPLGCCAPRPQRLPLASVPASPVGADCDTPEGVVWSSELMVKGHVPPTPHLQHCLTLCPSTHTASRLMLVYCSAADPRGPGLSNTQN